MKSVFIRPLALAVGLSALAGLAHAGDIRVMCYQDGVECEVTAELAKRFEAQNPGTKVIVDTVPYKSIVEQLPVQLAAGQGPDIARVTDLGGLSKYYMDISAHLKNRKYWDDNFGATAAWLRPSASDKGIYGFMSQLTMTGPFVNKTLFEQAKVPMPGAKATWDDWMEASRKVAKATQIKAAAAWDRSGHRFAGPAISYGAKIFDAQGNPVIDAGYKNAVNKFVGWHKDGGMMREVWAGSGGSTYASSIDEFINGNVAMVLAGSWQIGNLQNKVGTNFDWVAVPNPCGPAACSGIPGGAAWVALKTSKSPKEVGAFMDFMASEAAYAEFSARTNNIPAHAGLAKKGVDYASAKPAAKAALGVFSAGVAQLAPVAYQFQGYKFNRAIMLPTVSRVTQAIVGEMSTDEAVNKITADMQDAVKQAQK
ncbi:ABC transporter substrate-binding protein [Limnohabitans sp.]|uniref:ABC transporter substrate-binding protein n=1 Tax=Limnohabitans sp. TaxID=1907725 RepID=UPI002AFFFBAD|nr:ABC transporter substrate-binding protein [Limnohabitans sp.]